MSFIYYVLILMLSYTGPVYAEIGIEQNERSIVADDIEHYAQNTNEVEVGELPNGKIKIFVDSEHSITAVVDKQDCDVLKKKDDTIALGWKFGGLMWGFGPEIKIGHTSGVAWKGDVQRMVAEYQELCSRFNTGRVSQEEYNQEKGGIIKRGYNYARELEQRFKQKKDDMFKEMDAGKYIHLQKMRFFEGCCYYHNKPERNLVVELPVKVVPVHGRPAGSEYGFLDNVRRKSQHETRRWQRQQCRQNNYCNGHYVRRHHHSLHNRIGRSANRMNQSKLDEIESDDEDRMEEGNYDNNYIFHPVPNYPPSIISRDELPKYDDIIIWEYTLTNSGTHEITNFYFSPTTELTMTHPGGSDVTSSDDDLEWDIAHEAFYFHDGQGVNSAGELITAAYGLTGDDIGAPSDLEFAASLSHNFRAAHYFTTYWLDKPEKSDPSERDHMNIVDKGNLNQHSNRIQPDPMNDNPEVDFDTDAYILASLQYDNPLPLTTEDGTDLTAEAARLGLEIAAVQLPYEKYIDYLYTTGPYAMSPGEELKFVMVSAIGMMDEARVAAGGVENKAHLIDGRDSLWKNVDAAVELYARGYQMFDPSPTPTDGNNSLTLTPVPTGVKIQWPQIASTYTDVKTLSLSLIDEAFSSADYTVTAETIPETTIADTARRGKRFFFF